MTANRRTATATSNPGGIDDTALATDIDEEVLSLNDRGFTELSSIAGTNTITATGTPPLDSYKKGQKYILRPANNNTGAVTCNVDSKGARNLRDRAGNALIAGDIVAGREYLIYDTGTELRLLGEDSGAGIAGGMTLLATYTFSTAVATVDFTDIPAGYSGLLISIEGISSSSPADLALLASVNNGSSYPFNLNSGHVIGDDGGSPFSNKITNSEIFIVAAAANTVSGVILIHGHASSGYKLVQSVLTESSTGDRYAGLAFFDTASVINALRFDWDAGNFDAGVIRLYGIP